MIIVYGRPTIAHSFQFIKWKAFMRESKLRYHLTRCTCQQLTFENIIHNFTQQTTVAKNINNIEGIINLCLYAYNLCL
ncbi:unnamed protein product [Brugia pahangi]|uniref:Transposase n=1 Tax=Brugia pahangi TaxID=6280 RepID=A0A0N4TA95_BRUPA|nr:unnamed protein product [Brugia pahangi]